MPAAALLPDRSAEISWRLDPFIDGAYVKGEGAPLDVENPATAETIATVRQSSSEQLETAVSAARRVFDSGVWSRDPEFRREVLTRMADLLELRSAEFAAALIQEVGTPVALCQPLQVGGPLTLLRYLAERTTVDRTRRLGRDDRTPPSESLIRYEPIPVGGGIGAYNYPLMFPVSKACTAMAAGSSAVFMPSPQTPLASLMFGEIAAEAGVPAGVLNIVVGEAELGVALSSHPGIGKVSFTGSVDVGRKVMLQAGQNLSDVVLELGGKSAAIVLPDADMAKVALPLHSRYQRNAGQGCQSPTRHLVPRARFDEYVDASREAFETIKCGDPWDPKTLAGPLISKAHRDRVEGYIERALAAGGEILLGGGRPLERGYFLNPTLVGGVDNDSEIARNELFAPVAVAIPYDTVEDAVAMANDSDFGLAAHIYGPQDQAIAVAERMEAGTVYLNGGGQLRVDSVLTGWKVSGVGHEWGDDGIVEFLQAKHIQWTV
jgi:aldehyde dehydrogenase (NAD+)/betaine-aldehyde dehydrogenase